MEAFKKNVFVEVDGELCLKGLPCKKDTYVEVILLFQDPPTEEQRQEALRRMDERVEQMQFRSTGPYPTRDELHERR